MFALRVSVSVVIAAGLSLWFGWERPMWAMFAVIYCALGAEGESLHKGLLRTLATFIGCAMSLIFTAMFNDQRWAFGGAVLAWIMFCAYMMQGNRRWYMWQVAAWLTILMPIYSAEQPARAFEVVMLRLEETLLGLIVYTVVASVLLPDRRRSSFMHELRDQIKAVEGAVAHLAAAWQGDAGALQQRDRIRSLRNEALSLHVNFRNRIDVGIIENFDLMENRDAWQKAIDELEAILRLLNHFRLCLGDLPAAAVARPLPDIAGAVQEIERRLQETAAVLDGGRNVQLPYPLTIPRPQLPEQGGDVFAHGAVLVALETLDQIARRSAQLLTSVAEARGLTGRHAMPDTASQLLPRSFIPDPEHLAAVLRIGTIFSIAFLIYIFVPELPGGPQVILLSTIIGLFISVVPTMPRLPVWLTGNLVIMIAGVIHMVIMPKLSSFVGLGSVLFLYMFCAAAALSSPAVAPVRFLTMGFAVMIMQITPDQSYSFTFVVNMILVFQLPFALIWLTQSFPVSFRPERVFQRLLGRYMNSFGVLIDGFRRDERPRPRNWWQRQVMAWHLRNLIRIPDQMAIWIKAMPEQAMDAAGRQQAMALSQALFDLGGRMADLYRFGDVSYSPETVAVMHPAISAWRRGLEVLIANFRDAPEALPAAERLSALLEVHLAQVQADTRQVLNRTKDAGEDARDGTMMRELSLYRGLSEALISACRHASALNWSLLREPRF